MRSLLGRLNLNGGADKFMNRYGKLPQNSKIIHGGNQIFGFQK
jgi:hypothetical protein